MTAQNEYLYDTLGAQAQALGDIIAKKIEAAWQGATLLFPGGSSPCTLISSLATRSDIKWNDVYVSVGDERCVPIESEDSNAGQLQRLLGANITIHALWDHAAQKITPPPLPATICVLGMGGDAHIASLFPGGEWEEGDATTMRTQAPFLPYDRVSLTMSAILSSAHIILLVNGTEKEAVYQAAKNPHAETPLAYLLRNHRGNLSVHIVP